MSAISSMHLGRSPEFVAAGHVRKPDIALVEALAITENGDLVPTTSVGNTPAYVAEADAVIVEIAMAKPLELEGMADVYMCENRHSGSRFRSRIPGSASERLT